LVPRVSKGWKAFALSLLVAGVTVGGLMLLIILMLPPYVQSYAVPFLWLVGGIVVAIAAIASWGRRR
jgi:hypothetical protein